MHAARTRSTTLISVGTMLVLGAAVGQEIGAGVAVRVILAVAGVGLWLAAMRGERLTTARYTARLGRATGARSSALLDEAVLAAEERIESLRDELARERAIPWHQREHTRAIVESFGEAVMLIDEQGEVLLANDRCGPLLGLTDSPVGRHIEDLVTKADLLQEIATARRGAATRATIRLPRAGGVRVFETTAVPLFAGDHRHAVMLTMRDVTELANALQLKTDFVANASHELRTPIASIRAAADTLDAAGADEAMRARLIDMIRGHSVRLDELVRDLLDLSKLESQDAAVVLRPVSLTETAAELTEVLAEACSRFEVELEFDLHPSLDRVVSDRRLLMLIMKNLAENGVKFTKPGTAVRIQGRVVATPDRARDAMQLLFRDRGPGIPIAQQQRIFERFFQVDAARTGSERRGTGLGLAIVKHAAKLLNGSVGVQSVWGQGTTMIVDVPDCVERRPEPDAG